MSMQEMAATGIDGLDHVLGGGGFARNRLYLLQGNPGTGKTTLALQLLLAAVSRGETSLYITLSESKTELEQIARSHDWSLERINLFELSAIEQQLKQLNTVFEPAELELDQTTQALLAEVNRVKPAFVIFDSLSELRLLAQDPLRYRKQLLAFKQYFQEHHSTVFMCDDNTGTAADDQILSLAHGVVSLEAQTPEFGAVRRRLQISKLRGRAMRTGYHDFAIVKGGLRVFPRLIAAEHHRAFKREPISSGLPALDELTGGGVDRGTSTLLLGPAGCGKSTVATQFLLSCARQGMSSTYLTFEENLGTFHHRLNLMAGKASQAPGDRLINARQIDPAEVTPGELAHQIRGLVETSNSHLVVIDSLNGYLNAMPDQRYLLLHLHELLSYLAQRGVATLLTVAQHGTLGNMTSPIDTTYLADTVLLFRFFEHAGRVKKAISVIKKRTGDHEDSIRELKVDGKAIEIGQPLYSFSGVLTGTPKFTGQSDKIMTSADGKAGA